MKCSECGEVSTFTHQWRTSVNHISPFKIDEYGDLYFELDGCKCLDDESEYDESNASTRCDKCRKEVELVSIEVVDIKEDVTAA